MKLLFATLAFGAAAFLVPLGDKCADCASQAAHDEGNGAVEITAEVAQISGDCTLQPTCSPNDKCEVTGTVKVKNVSNNTVRVTRPTGAVENVPSGGSIDLQLIVLHTEKACGVPFELPIFTAAGAPLGEVKFHCHACPVGVE